MIVYLDLYIILNFSLCYLQLLLTKKIYNKKTNVIRIVLGSIVGTAYSLAAFIKVPEFIKCIVPVAIVAFVFKFNSLTDFIRTAVIFYTVLFVFGGCAYAMSKSLFVLSTVVSYVVLWLMSLFYKRMCVKKNSLANVVLLQKNSIVSFTGLVDTGNSLCDPYTGLPVMIVCKRAINTENVMPRLISYRTVGGSSFIKVFTPDKVYVNKKEVKCAIGIYEKCLSADGSFDALLTTDMI